MILVFNKTLLLITGLIVSFELFALPSVKVTLFVVDENGVPVEDAKAGVNFEPGSSGNRDTGVTDSDGLVELSGSSRRFITYGAGKDGYYGTTYQKSYTKFTGITGFRKWQPWNETVTVKIRKILKPRALYIGNHNGLGGEYSPVLILPGLDREYAYDLTAGDWVVPYGIGTHRDFIFKLTGVTTGFREYDYTLVLTFANEGDGIQIYKADPVYGSRLRLPHNAPESGYESNLVQRNARELNRLIHMDFSDEKRNYFFRVRTTKNNKGNIESSLYGKIYGNIKFFDQKIMMLYYLNPDSNDRNLESDYKKNLFPSKEKYGFTEYPP